MLHARAPAGGAPGGWWLALQLLLDDGTSELPAAVWGGAAERLLGVEASRLAAGEPWAGQQAEQHCDLLLGRSRWAGIQWREVEGKAGVCVGVGEFGAGPAVRGSNSDAPTTPPREHQEGGAWIEARLARYYPDDAAQAGSGGTATDCGAARYAVLDGVLGCGGAAGVS